MILFALLGISSLCMASNKIPASMLLNEDGTLNLRPGIQGTLNTAGFHLELDPCKGPVLSETAASAIVANSWSALGSGLNGNCFALVMDGLGNLYAGGTFTSAGGVPASRIAKWDGTSWSALGLGVNNAVNALIIDNNGHLIAAGDFTTAGGMAANRIARWDGMSWSPLGSGLNNGAVALAKHPNGDIYVGGLFGTAGGVTVNFIARWNGFSWSALGPGLGAFYCFAIAIDGMGNVYAGGDFTNIGGNNNMSRIAMWNGSSWSPLGTGFNAACNAIAIDQNGIVYAAGWFTTAGGIPASRVAKWNGSFWSALGAGLSDFSTSIVFDQNNNPIVAGRAFSSGGQFVGYLTIWNGSTWMPFAGGANATCEEIYQDQGGNIYVGGYFTQVGGSTAANRIAKYGSDELNTYYRDMDGDGYGDAFNTIQASFPPSGYTFNDDDCDDTNQNIHPNQYEMCNGYDDNCNNMVDEGYPYPTIPQSPLAAQLNWDKFRFSWFIDGFATLYEMQWREVGDPMWNTVTTIFDVVISGLPTQQNFEWRVRAKHCSGNYTDWTPTMNFTTTNCGNPEVSYLTLVGNIALVAWTPVPTRIKYLFRHRQLPNGNWVNGLPQTTTNTRLLGINPNLNYELQLATQCPYGFSEWSESYYFPSGSRPSDNSIKLETGVGQPGTLTILPNPANDYLQIDGLLPDIATGIEMFDLTGRLVYSQKLPAFEEVFTQIETASFNPGLYTLKISWEGGSRAERIVIHH